MNHLGCIRQKKGLSFYIFRERFITHRLGLVSHVEYTKSADLWQLSFARLRILWPIASSLGPVAHRQPSAAGGIGGARFYYGGAAAGAE